MDNLRPEENLAVIRTLMERSALYRRALAPIMAVTGAIGATAAVLTPFCPAPFVRYWSAVAVGTCLIAIWMVRRQALKEHDSFWSPPTRRVVHAMALPFSAALLITIPFLCCGDDHAVQNWLALSLWLICYGCGLHAAGFYTLRGLRWLGIGFVLAGVGLFVALTNSHMYVAPRAQNWIMGLTFGGFHLLYAIYLYATRERAGTP